MFFGKKLPGDEGSVRRCVVVMQQPVLLSPKFGGEVIVHFHTFAVKRHTSMRTWLFGLPGRIVYEQSHWYQHALDSVIHPSRFFVLDEFGLYVYGSCFLPRTLVKSFTVSPLHLFRDLHKMWCCSFVRSIAKSHQARYTIPNKRKIRTSTLLHEILHTESQDMIVLSPIAASCYCNCCTDGSTSPKNYGYPLVFKYTWSKGSHFIFR
jgi:hypothetical protein